MSSVTHTVEDLRRDTSNINGRDLDLDGRDLFLYETEATRSIDDCNIAVGLARGIAVFTVNYMNVGDGVDPCELVLGHLADLEFALPQ